MSIALSKILVAVDGSPHSESALEVAVGLAKLCSASLSIVTVVPAPVVVSGTTPWIPPQMPVSQADYYHDVLIKATARAEGLGVKPKTVISLEGHVVEELLTYVDKVHPDLLLVGSRGLSTAHRLLMGSVSDSLVHHVKCSILVVKKAR